MNKHITITDISDLRVGDTATYSYKGHEFSGEVWDNDLGALWVGPVVVRHFGGTPSPYIALVSATREVPHHDLPTEVGSVIANVVLKNGGHYDLALLVDPADSAGLTWVVSEDSSYDWAHPDDIISWTPCTVEVQEDTD